MAVPLPTPPVVPISSLSVVNPLCIILVKNGSKGDRLLFRYPYKAEDDGRKIGRRNRLIESTLLETPSVGQTKSRKISDILLSPPPLDSFDEYNNSFSSPTGTGKSGSSNRTSSSGGTSGSSRSRKSSRTSPPNMFWKRSPYMLDKTADSEVFMDDAVQRDQTTLGIGQQRFVPEGNQMLSELSDKDLSNLLAVSSDLSERKFELKLNYVRFVGHPTLMHHPKDIRPINPMFQTSVKLFHIVFCLNAVASHSIVKCFHDLSKRLGIALRHEEHRCGFLHQEMKNIISIHDEACTEHLEDKHDEQRVQERIFNELLSKSKVAQLMKRVYDDVVARGCTFVRVNNWVQISFCLPQKIHTLPFRGQAPLVEPEAIHRCLEAIRPYHAILLLVDTDDLIGSLWLDASSTIPRLLQVYSPLKSLQTMAADADLTLSQVVEIASHLVYWAQATVIYPLCESNIYVIAPDFPITSVELRKSFSETFPGLSLAQIVADFSLPMPLGERVNPVLGGNSLQAQHVQVVTWMLKHHLLVHLHTFVYLTTYFDGSMMESGMDYLSAFTGDPDGTTNLALNIRPFEVEEDDATASDTFSETTADEVGVNQLDILNPLVPSNSNNGLNEDLTLVSEIVKSQSSETVNPVQQQTSTTVAANTEESEDSVVNIKEALSELNEAVKRAVIMVKYPIMVQDIKMFSRLSKYFTGDFHFEEIMYRENVRRSQLLLLLDKFRDVLITVEKEDAEINFFKLL